MKNNRSKSRKTGKSEKMSTAYPDLETIWPGWKIEALLGKGLGGNVYRAARRVNGIVMESAVKIMFRPEDRYDSEHPHAGDVQDYDVALYKSKADDGITEISCLLTLKDCDHVVDIEDFALVKRDDAIEWDVYIRMELLRSLIDYLGERQRLTEDELIKLGLDLADVLLHCERNNIVQRDFKVENLYITEGGYKLGDFGIAIKLGETESAFKKGNRNYMAPEVFWERKYGRTTDIYSVGIILYMLANGNKMPFFDSDYFFADDAEKERAFNRRVHGEKIPDTSDASPELNYIILKTLNYAPEDRYPDAEALIEALKSLKGNR
jgi:serine/threonine protein kinase